MDSICSGGENKTSFNISTKNQNSNEEMRSEVELIQGTTLKAEVMGNETKVPNSSCNKENDTSFNILSDNEKCFEKDNEVLATEVTFEQITTEISNGISSAETNKILSPERPDNDAEISQNLNGSFGIKPSASTPHNVTLDLVVALNGLNLNDDNDTSDIFLSCQEVLEKSEASSEDYSFHLDDCSDSIIEDSGINNNDEVNSDKKLNSTFTKTLEANDGSHCGTLVIQSSQLEKSEDIINAQTVIANKNEGSELVIGTVKHSLMEIVEEHKSDSSDPIVIGDDTEMLNNTFSKTLTADEQSSSNIQNVHFQQLSEVERTQDKNVSQNEVKVGDKDSPVCNINSQQIPESEESHHLTHSQTYVDNGDEILDIVNDVIHMVEKLSVKVVEEAKSQFPKTIVEANTNDEDEVNSTNILDGTFTSCNMQAFENMNSQLSESQSKVENGSESPSYSTNTVQIVNSQQLPTEEKVKDIIHSNIHSNNETMNDAANILTHPSIISVEEKNQSSDTIIIDDETNENDKADYTEILDYTFSEALEACVPAVDNVKFQQLSKLDNCQNNLSQGEFKTRDEGSSIPPTLCNVNSPQLSESEKLKVLTHANNEDENLITISDTVNSLKDSSVKTIGQPFKTAVADDNSGDKDEVHLTKLLDSTFIKIEADEASCDVPVVENSQEVLELEKFQGKFRTGDQDSQHMLEPDKLQNLTHSVAQENGRDENVNNSFLSSKDLSLKSAEKNENQSSDIIIIDDEINEKDEANSIQILDATFNETLEAKLENGESQDKNLSQAEGEYSSCNPATVCHLLEPEKLQNLSHLETYNNNEDEDLKNVTDIVQTLKDSSVKIIEENKDQSSTTIVADDVNCSIEELGNKTLETDDGSSFNISVAENANCQQLSEPEKAQEGLKTEAEDSPCSPAISHNSQQILDLGKGQDVYHTSKSTLLVTAEENKNGSSDTIVIDDDDSSDNLAVMIVNEDKFQSCTDDEKLSLDENTSKDLNQSSITEAALLNYSSILSASPSVISKNMFKHRELSSLLLQINELHQTVSKLKLEIKNKEEIIIKNQIERDRFFSESKKLGSGAVVNYQLIDELKQINHNLKDKHENEIKALKHEISTLQGNLQSSKQKEKDLQLKLEQCEAEKTEFNNLLKFNDELIENVTAKHEGLKRELAQSKKDLTSFEKAFLDLKENYDHARSVIKGMEENELLYKNEIQSLKSVIESLRNPQKKSERGKTETSHIRKNFPVTRKK